MNLPFLPVAAAESAHRVDALFLGWVILAGLTTAVLMAAMLFLAVRYRAGSDVDRTEPELPVLWIELTWTAVPLVLFLGMFGWSAWAYYVDYNAPKDADEVYVVGKQWMWKIQHPTGQREINQLHLPVGRPVKLVMTSQDAIHSFFVPAFRIKQDVLPGRYTTEWFKPTQTGTYHLFCAEFCGTNHALMGGNVVVQTPADYQAWLAHQGQLDDMAVRGGKLFRSAGCTGCHGPSATVHAPRLEGVFGRAQPLATGGFALADEAYVRDSILNPAKQVVAGYAPVMPSFKGQLSEDEVLELVAYVKSLADASPERSAP